MGNDMQQRSPSGLESDKLQLMVKKKKKNKEMETELMFSHVKSRIWHVKHLKSRELFMIFVAQLDLWMFKLK